MKCIHAGTPNAVKGCARDCANVRGFKSHMTRAHDGWTEADIAQWVAGDRAEIPAPAGEALPFDGESPQEAPGAPQGAQEGNEPTRRKRAAGASVKLSKALKEAKAFVCQIFPDVTCAFLTQKLEREVRLEEKSKALITELWEGFLDLLGIDIENVDPVTLKIGGRKILILAPLLITAATFALAVKGPKVESEKPPAVTPESAYETKNPA